MTKSPNKLDLSQLFKSAFAYWSATLRYQLLFTIFYFSVMIIFLVFVYNYLGLYEKVNSFAPLLTTDFPAYQKKLEELGRTEEFKLFTMAFVLIKALVFPLNIGLLQIYRKIDLQEEVSINDLFTGYLGFNFLKFAGYGLFASSIYLIAFSLFPLNFIWILLSFFVSPLMLFANQGIFPALQLNFAALRKNFSTILLCTIVSILFSYSGILMFGIGIVLTFPFWNAMIYALYQQLFNEIK
ncbi:hypothetical protein [Chryseobacterium sp. T1]